MFKTSSPNQLLLNIVPLFVFILFSAQRCNSGYRAIEDERIRKAAAAVRTKNLIKTIKGIKYTEVKRVFDNGLSFTDVGFQLVPEWRISFPGVDSVTIYSPKKKRFLNGPVVFDHDSIFNVAWAWLKLIHLSKDSLKFQVLHVTDNVINDEKIHVYMTLYANNYITNKLHADTATFWHPSKKDTLMIKAMCLKANANPENAFAGTDPVELSSKSPLVTIVKETIPDNDPDGGKIYDEYLLPTFDITIHKAYDTFNYLFSVYVNDKGEIIFRKSNQASYPEFEKSTLETMKGITDGYLKLYLKTKPGKTLGIPHTSIILLNVSGYKN